MPASCDWIVFSRNELTGVVQLYVKKRFLNLQDLALLARWHDYVLKEQAEEEREGAKIRTR